MPPYSVSNTPRPPVIMQSGHFAGGTTYWIYPETVPAEIKGVMWVLMPANSVATSKIRRFVDPSFSYINPPGYDCATATNEEITLRDCGLV